MASKGDLKIEAGNAGGLAVSLRPWRRADIGSLVKYANNKAIADNLRDGFPHPYTRKDAIRFLGMAGSDDPHTLILAIDLGGEAVGSIGAFMKQDIYRKNMEIGYWLAEPFWGRGIMTSVIRSFLPQLWNFYDIRRIYAEPFAGNTASRKALEKAGFGCEAIFRQNVIKNGVFLDSCIYSILRENYRHED